MYTAVNADAALAELEAFEAARSARSMRDEQLVREIVRVYEQNLFVYGADKMWAHLNRENIRVARCTVERLMKAQGLIGAKRGKAFTITTTTDDRLVRPTDLVARQFRAPAPNRLWVADIERHEAFLNRAVVKGRRHRLVAASRLKLRAACVTDRLVEYLYNCAKGAGAVV